jgi:hypothetical protein
MYMTHSSQVVNLIGLNLLDNAYQVRTIGHIPIVQNKFLIVNMRILLQVIDSIGIKKRGTAFYAMNHVSFFKEKLTQISTVLSCDASN